MTKYLDHMTTKDFNWDEKTWKVDYCKISRDFIESLAGAMALFYPGYTLDWILRTDACDVGYGGVLYHVRLKKGKKVYEPLKFISKRWYTVGYL